MQDDGAVDELSQAGRATKKVSIKLTWPTRSREDSQDNNYENESKSTACLSGRPRDTHDYQNEDDEPDQEQNAFERDCDHRTESLACEQDDFDESEQDGQSANGNVNSGHGTKQGSLLAIIACRQFLTR